MNLALNNVAAAVTTTADDAAAAAATATTSRRVPAPDASVRELMRAFLPLLERPGVTELVVNRPGSVMLESNTGWETVSVPELTFDKLMSIAVAIAQFTQQEISARRPILSAMLPAGERIQIVVPPVTEPGTVSLTIRRPSATIRTLEEYEAGGVFEALETAGATDTGDHAEAGDHAAGGMLSRVDRELVLLRKRRQWGEFFRQAVRAKKNIAIVGDTGSGKTTFMKTLCQCIPRGERILTIEDTRELFMPAHDNRVHLLYSKGGQGVAWVTPAELIASAMRMKPDRVLLAEMRGAEAYDFLKLLTTGHSGSITSFHAANVAVAIERFALMAKEHPEAATYETAALKRLLALTVDIVAHFGVVDAVDAQGRLVDKQRRMTGLYFDPERQRAIRDQD